MKKIILLLLIAVLCFVSVPNTANAAVKISDKEITLDIGKSATLKISDTKKTVKWSSSDEDVATVTKKGKITAIAAGEATITATVSKKKYTCKVTVNNENPEIKNIGEEYTDLKSGVVGILTNNNNYPISLTATVIFYDASGSMIDKSTDGNDYLESGKKCVLYFYGPWDSNLNRVPYSSYTINYSVNNVDYTKSNLSNIKTESNIGADKVMVKVSNNRETPSSYTNIGIVFYKNGKVVGGDNANAKVENPGSEDYLLFDFPYDQNYDTIQIDSYEIFINYSYSYTL
jgi:hypothetical protein